MTNGAPTCRDIEGRLLDLKSMQNPVYFGTFSGRVGDIADFGPIWGDVSARWSTVCQEFYIFIFGFFPEPRYI